MSTSNFNSRHAISLSPTPSLTATSSTPGVIAVHVPIYDPAKWQGWPHAMYTIDMAETLFSLIFGSTPFVQAMYCQNHKS
ncbi:hypothetical protein BDR05DRAFT_1005874 [Suillus weaverae]|nr:hypothetical protein BDR05DRAFT_1005874 [Suillus weaverae]